MNKQNKISVIKPLYTLHFTHSQPPTEFITLYIFAASNQAASIQAERMT